MSPQTFIDVINQILPEPHASLLAGMIFGVKATMPKDFYQALITTGTLHIIALSGTNITILINVLGKVFIVFGRRISLILTAFSIAGFVLFVGPSASVIRASIMGVITILSLYVGRANIGVLSLLVAGIVMLTVKPEWVWDAGFQLSFLATLGIIVFGGDVNRKVESGKWKMGVKEITAKIWSVVAIDLRTTLAAQVFTLPVMVVTFHQLSIVAPLTNILVGWTVQLIMIVGIIATILGFIWLPLGMIASIFVYPMLEYFIVVVEWTAKLPWAAISI